MDTGRMRVSGQARSTSTPKRLPAGAHGKSPQFLACYADGCTSTITDFNVGVSGSDV